ncbi:glycosyltransferase family 4 protein [Nocardioides hwasunensis]|uniref:Glycosyltransferase family 4 protein n=1 Tax=Nocardioides hwasunensis TaxID=397258 RepID=A0ABR8MQ24_9ACTN|nr:glycosyltransferase family 4 protein [Nocardioides hwasunensis]MBD3916649.1 glycosyltransferase family 4 protein [Nocardioides hwasunensis]
MKIAFISQWFDPETGSAAIPGAIARALQDQGHDMTVVTGYPNYPTGELYGGYRMKLLQREDLRGLRVLRVPLYPSHDSSAVHRALNFLSFMFSASSLGALIARRSEVALVYSTPATIGLAGWVLRRLLRTPFVLFIQDLWPDTVTATGMVPARITRPVEHVLGAFCQRIYAAASVILVISPGMKELLVERGVPETKIRVVYNWIDEDMFRPVEPVEVGSDTFDVMYAGNLGDVQGLETAVRAIARLDDLPHVRLRLVGDGVARGKLADLAAQLGVAERVVFEGTRPVEEMSTTMASAHIQLVCLKDIPLFRVTMPSKIQGILASGQPMIVCAPGDAAALAERSGAGVTTKAGDVGALAAAIRHCSLMPSEKLRAMGRRGHLFYERELSAKVGVMAMEQALEEAARWRA